MGWADVTTLLPIYPSKLVCQGKHVMRGYYDVIKIPMYN